MKALLNKLLCGVAILLLAPGLAFAQDGVVTGTVTDAETGDPLPGATVQISELGVGGATDIDGNFEFDVPEGTHDISASFVGYESITKTIEVTAGETTAVDFAIAPSAQQLEEVVVSGYRARQKSQESGSSTIVTADRIETLTARDPQQALQGQAAGVQVVNTSGQPGAAPQFNIRGVGSITSGNEPLIIVDGVQLSNDLGFDELGTGTGASALSGINTADIESIEILKDAAATSIYGAQAANGVVLITTKRGRSGDTEISFNSQIGVVDQLRDFDVLNTPDFLNFVGDGYANAGIAADRAGGIAIATDPSSPTSLFVGPENVQTDWPGAVYRQGVSQTYNLSVRGGNENTTFFASGRYSNDEGQVIGSSFRSGGMRLNLGHQPADFLSIEANANLSTNTWRGAIQGGPFITSPFWAGYLLPPNSTIYTVQGDPSSGFNLRPNRVFTFNPVAQETFNDRESNATQIIANTAVNIDLTDNITTRTYAGLSFADLSEEEYQDPRLPGNAGAGGILQQAADRIADYNVSQTVEYSNVFSDVHAVSGLFGAEFKRQEEERTDYNTQGFPLFLLRTADSAADPQVIVGGKTEFRQLSFFSDVDYTYDQTYQIRSTFRLDGSSRFGADRRYGAFGTVAGYWRISNMGFMDFDFLNDLKLRASYGVTGNSDIDNFESLALFASNGEYAATPALGTSQLANPGLTWEQRNEVNVGLDYDLFNGRVSGSVDAYRAVSTNLLLERDLPNDSGFTFFQDNVGELETRGLEFSLETVNLDIAGFQWRTDFNIAFQDIEVTELLPDDNEIVIDTGEDDDVFGGGIFRVGNGPSQYDFVRYAGVNPANGAPLYLDQNGQLTYDGTNPDDEVLLDGPFSDFFGGFGNTFSYKGLSLRVFFNYDYGRRTLNNDAFFLRSNAFFYLNRDAAVLDYWQEPGDITDTPAPTPTASYSGNSAAIFTTRYYEDASYIRLKEVKLAYSLPQSVLSTIRLRRANVFVQGNNLATWTEYTGFDPEVVGTALGVYPAARTITGGISLTY